jgi:hypothetical protein
MQIRVALLTILKNDVKPPGPYEGNLLFVRAKHPNLPYLVVVPVLTIVVYRRDHHLGSP